MSVLSQIWRFFSQASCQCYPAFRGWLQVSGTIMKGKNPQQVREESRQLHPLVTDTHLLPSVSSISIQRNMNRETHTSHPKKPTSQKAHMQDKTMASSPDRAIGSYVPSLSSQNIHNMVCKLLLDTGTRRCLTLRGKGKFVRKGKSLQNILLQTSPPAPSFKTAQ